MKIQLFIIFTILSLISCKNTDTEISANSLFDKAETVRFPYIDSTNFDNLKEKTKLSDPEISALHLKKINENLSDCYLRYKIPFSNNFTSIVVTYKNGEHELLTTLINYDKKNNIVDKIDIAYDETAESAFRKTSSITKHNLEINNINLMEESPTKEINKYKISDIGTFEKIK
jgi:hypothetical protein